MVVKTNENDENASKEEKHFEFYLKELLKENIILSYKRADTYSVNNKDLIITWLEEKPLKTKVKQIPKKLDVIVKKVYTPDFEIVWNFDNENCFKFVNVLNKYKKPNHFICNEYQSSLIEIKPEYDEYNMTRLFKTNQAVMWDKHNLFINLIIPETLFKNTFTPNNVKIPVNIKTKVQKWKRVALKEFLNK